MKKLLIPALITTAFTTGCSTVQMKNEADSFVKKEMDVLKSEVVEKRELELRTEVVDERYIKAEISDYNPSLKGNITQSLNNASMYAAFQGIAEQGGYSVAVTSDVDTSTKITLDLRNMSTEEALREIASVGGYVAVIDKSRQRATLTKWATYTFKLPRSVFRAPDVTANMSASPTKASSGGSNGGSGGGGVDSTFNIKSEYKSEQDALKKMLEKMAGDGSSVDVSADTGIINIRAQAQQLRRVSDFLKDYVKSSMMQVEIETSIVEVNLDDQQQTGVDWSKMFKPGGASVPFKLGTADLVSGSVSQIGYTTSSITSVLKMLGQSSNYRILDQDTRSYQNNVPAVFFKGSENPYIPQVQATTTTGTSTSTSTSASLEMAMDGIALGVLPNIINSNILELDIRPMVSRLGPEQTYKVTTDVSLKGFKTDKNLANNKIILQNGRTVIVSRTIGSRLEEANTGLPGVNKTIANNALGYSSKKVVRFETVLMVHPRIIPAPKFDILVGESI